MNDIGHNDTERLIADMSLRVQRHYQEAFNQVEARLKEFLQDFAAEDKEKKKKLKAGTMSREQYKRWRAEKLRERKHWEDMGAALAVDIHNANQIARSIVQGYLPEAYAINMNYGTYLVEHGANIQTNFTLYNRETVERLLRDDYDLIPHYNSKLSTIADEVYQKRRFQSLITQSILTGESIPRIAKRVSDELRISNTRSTIMYARTAMTGAQNAGREDSYRRMEAMGIHSRKMWIATLDNRTRHEHRQLDGQTVDIDKPFEVDGYNIRYPGDVSAPPHLVWNCRCRTIPQMAGYEIDPRDLRLRNTRKLGDMTYDEWKNELLEKGRNNPYGESRKENAVWFEEREEADKYLRPKVDSMWGALSDEEKFGVWKYTENSNPMNKVLSGYEGSWGRDSFIGVGRARWNYEDAWRKSYNEFVQYGHRDGTVDHARAIAAATRAIEHSRLDSDMWLVRGSDSNGLAGLIEGDVFSFNDALGVINSGDPDLIRESFIGQRFVNHAFTSTGVAFNAGFGGNVAYRIYAPRGTRCLYAEPQSAYGNTVGSEDGPEFVKPRLYYPGIKRNAETIGYEAEIIVQRGTEYRITDIDVDGENMTVTMEIVSQPKYFESGYEQTYDNGVTSYERPRRH